MRSSKTSSPGMRRGETRRAPLEVVRISRDLIAFYPQPIHRLQPYVILLDQASGILKRLDLQAGAGARARWRSSSLGMKTPPTFGVLRQRIHFPIQSPKVEESGQAFLPTRRASAGDRA
jgi:hypothetical protein